MEAGIKIFINNFPKPVREIVPIAKEGNDSRVSSKYKGPRRLLGFEMGGNVNELYYNAMSKFFISFLLYDEIILRDADFIEIIKRIGVEDGIALLRSNKLKLVYDKVDIAMEFVNSTGSILKLSNELISIPALNYIDINFKEFSNKKSLRPQIIQCIDNALLDEVQSIKTNDDIDIHGEAYDELVKELNSPDVSSAFLSGIESIDEMSPYQSTKALRLLNTLKGFSFQSRCNAEIILQDSFSRSYLDKKLSFLQSSKAIDKIELFSEVTNLKGIPDIYHLVKSGVLKVQNIIEISETYEANLFRNWFAKGGISREDVYFKLMRYSKESNFSKSMRWLYPNIAGLVNTVLGVAASGVDSFIVDKILKGWSPNIFLDDFLKSNLDKLIEKNDRLNKRNELITCFGSIKTKCSLPLSKWEEI